MMTPEDTRKGNVGRDEAKSGNGSSKKTSADAAAEAGGGNLEKIRDILFGAQVHDFEKRFARLEERLLKETADARADTKKRFESLENFIRKEVESLADRLKAEQGDRAEAVKEVGRELRETAKALEKRLAVQDEQATKSQRELRQQILDQSKSLTEEIRSRNRETTTTLSRELTELRAEKTDRAALAGFLTDVAVRLTNDVKAPGKG
jgi:DNA anti-recombination protein RmuC